MVNYFRTDFDLDVQVAASRLSRRVLTSPPLRFNTIFIEENVRALTIRFLSQLAFDWRNHSWKCGSRQC